MVIIVYAEGGILSGNTNADTLTNDTALREELNKIFSKALSNKDVRIIVKTTGGYKNAAKSFIESDAPIRCLYVDLDRSPDLREDWFVEIEKQGFAIEDELKSHVFFWIQEMEAWFLKQTSAIEEWAQAEGFIRNKGIICDISQFPEIKDKNIERLQHKPSLVLYNLLKKTYYMNINGEKKSIKYGKLRHAPDLLSHLDVFELLAKDNEFRTFVDLFSRG